MRENIKKYLPSSFWGGWHLSIRHEGWDIRNNNRSIRVYDWNKIDIQTFLHEYWEKCVWKSVFVELWVDGCRSFRWPSDGSICIKRGLFKCSEWRLSLTSSVCSKLGVAKSSAIILFINVAMPSTMFNWPISDSFDFKNRHVSSKLFSEFLKISNFWLSWLVWRHTDGQTDWISGIRIIPMQCGQWKAFDKRG